MHRASISTGLGLLAPLALAACADDGYPVRFSSEQERACYDRAAAELDNPLDALVRVPGGGFVIVRTVDGFTRNTRPSETFDTCMGRGTVETTTGFSSIEGPPVTLSAADRRIWDGLTIEQKRRAVVVLRQGGTLADFVASES